MARQGTRTRPRRRANPLSSPEVEILELMAEGLSTRQIAERLGVTQLAVRAQVQSVLTRLGVHPGPPSPSHQDESLARVLDEAGFGLGPETFLRGLRDELRAARWAPSRASAPQDQFTDDEIAELGRGGFRLGEPLSDEPGPVARTAMTYGRCWPALSARKRRPACSGSIRAGCASSWGPARFMASSRAACGSFLDRSSSTEGRVGDVKVVYDRLPTSELDAACLEKVAVPAGAALNDDIRANNIWNNCIGDINWPPTLLFRENGRRHAPIEEAIPAARVMNVTALVGFTSVPSRMSLRTASVATWATPCW